MNKAYNKNMARKLMQRLSELQAADSLEDVGKFRPPDVTNLKAVAVDWQSIWCTHTV